MSLEDFMNDPLQEEVSESVDNFFTIARAEITPCFQGWQHGANPKLFPHDGSPEDGLAARERCSEYCQGEKSFPQPGILTVVYADDVPTHPDGRFERDWHDFVPVYHSREKFKDASEISGELPYNMVMAGLQNNQSVYRNSQWCKLAQVVDAVKKFQGKENKNGYPYRFFVVEEVYENREAAYAAAGKSPDENKEDDFGDFGGVDDGLSAYAKENGWVLEELQKQSQEIHNQIAGAQKGENTPENKSLSSKEAKVFVCEQYLIKPEDLKLLNVEVAF